MKSLSYFKKNYIVMLALALFFIALTINRNLTKPNIIISREDETWNLNDKMIQNFNLGFKRLESSFLWISTILESDVEHYKKQDLSSWMFLRFRTIAELEPKFYENYLFGGMYLSIIKDDLAGATYIYDKGLSIYPNDFDLLKNAAYHFHFEVGDLRKSYIIYSKLKSHPRTSGLMLSSLARLESQNGNLAMAFELLKSQYEKVSGQKSFVGSAILEHMYAIKAEIDLKCLNLKNTGCSSVDLDKNPYFYNGTVFVARKAWIPFRPKGKKVPHQ